MQVDGIDPDITYEGVAKPPPHVVERAPPTYTSQTQAVTELRILSQPTTVSDLSKLPDYVFDDKAGSGVYIYLLDDGINTAPIVSKPKSHHNSLTRFHCRAVEC